MQSEVDDDQQIVVQLLAAGGVHRAQDVPEQRKGVGELQGRKLPGAAGPRPPLEVGAARRNRSGIGEGRHEEEGEVDVFTLEDLGAETSGHWRRAGGERLRVT